MASDLVLRLCQVDEADGGLPGAGKSLGEPGYDPQTAHIAIADFDILGGYHTIAAIKTILNMSPTQQTSFDTLVALVNSAPQNIDKLGRVMRIASILSKWQRIDDFPIPAYDSPDDVETHLLALDTGF
jgi:hypothetical protein